MIAFIDKKAGYNTLDFMTFLEVLWAGHIHISKQTFDGKYHSTGGLSIFICSRSRVQKIKPRFYRFRAPVIQAS